MYGINVQTQETFSERRADEYAKHYAGPNHKGEYHSLKNFTERGARAQLLLPF